VTLEEPVGITRRTSLQARIILLVAAAVAIAVAAAAAAAIFIARDRVHQQFDQDLLGRADAVAVVIPSTLRFNSVPPSTGGVALGLVLVRAGGQVDIPQVQGEPQPPISSLEIAVAEGRHPFSIRDALMQGQAVRVVSVDVPGQAGIALVLAESLAPIDHTVRVITLFFGLVGLLGVIFAGLAGWLIARAVLRPVHRLTSATEEIARTEDLTPIPVDGDDEIARLTMAFNSMLVALDRSRTRQRQLVADAGHELRTPLTSLRTNLDLLAQNESTDQASQLSGPERAALMSDLRAQISELAVLVDDLVALSRDESAPVELGQLDLADVVDRAVERVRRRAPGLHFDVRAQPWEMLGDDAALERAVTNLLDNAAKWSPPGGTVKVELQQGRLVIADQGPGIAEPDAPHVFERFYRSPEARALPGSGLGLAIVAQVVERHGGTVEAGRGPAGGAVMTVDLPGDAPAAAPAFGEPEILDADYPDTSVGASQTPLRPPTHPVAHD
jgi:two-component system, OmpR family, sensor histidine kinase MprB